MKYGEHGFDGCAFPALLPEEMGVREGYFDAGMTKREHAAITLRVPDSGDEQIDAMIRQANRRDAAVAAMQGITMEEYTRFGMDSCVNFAMMKTDALLARLEDANNG